MGMISQASITIALAVMALYSHAGSNDFISKAASLPARAGQGFVWAVDFDPVAKLLATGNNFQVDVWNWAQNRLEVTIPLPVGVVPQLDARAVQFSSDGSLLAVITNGAAQDLVVQVFHTNDWSLANDIVDAKSIRVVGIAFTRGSKTLLTANDLLGRAGDALASFDLLTGSRLWGIDLGRFRAKAIALSPDSNQAAIAGQMTMLIPPEAPEFNALTNKTKQVTQIFIIDLAARSVLRSWTSDAGSQLAWNRDGSRLAVVGGSSLEIYEVATGQRALRMEEFGYSHQNVSFTADARFLIDSDGNGQGSGRGIHIRDANRLSLLQGIRANAWCIAVSRDSKFLAVGEDGKTAIWRIM